MIIKVGCAEGRLGLVRRLRLEELTGSGGMESRQSSDVEGHTIVIEADAHTGVGSWYGLEQCFGCMFSTDLGGRCRHYALTSALPLWLQESLYGSR